MDAKRHAQPSVRLCALLAGHVVRVRSFDVSVERSSPRGYAFFIPLGSGERPSASPLLSQDDNSIPKTAADGRGGIQTHPFAPFLLRTLRLRRMNRRFRRICRGPEWDSTVPWFDCGGGRGATRPTSRGTRFCPSPLARGVGHLAPTQVGPVADDVGLIRRCQRSTCVAAALPAPIRERKIMPSQIRRNAVRSGRTSRRVAHGRPVPPRSP